MAIRKARIKVESLWLHWMINKHGGEGGWRKEDEDRVRKMTDPFTKYFFYPFLLQTMFFLKGLNLLLIYNLNLSKHFCHETNSSDDRMCRNLPMKATYSI